MVSLVTKGSAGPSTALTTQGLVNLRALGVSILNIYAHVSCKAVAAEKVVKVLLRWLDQKNKKTGLIPQYL